jgi:hypothetical protein
MQNDILRHIYGADFSFSESFRPHLASSRNLMHSVLKFINSIFSSRPGNLVRASSLYSLMITLGVLSNMASNLAVESDLHGLWRLHE